jgi:hypothetical protein
MTYDSFVAEVLSFCERFSFLPVNNSGARMVSVQYSSADNKTHQIHNCAE